MHLLKRGMIVSCQALPGEPMYGHGVMGLFANAAKEGGASGIRALYDDIAEIKKLVDLPIIGLVKKNYPDSEIYITPTKTEVDLLLQSECEVICMDATNRPRPNGETLEQLYLYARQHCGNRELLADVATLEEAIFAEQLGFDYISTTLRGYTAETASRGLPDLEFVMQCKNKIKKACVIAEGGVFEVTHMKELSKINPYAVVVGSAITRPKVITERLVGALNLYEEA